MHTLELFLNSRTSTATESHFLGVRAPGIDLHLGCAEIVLFSI